MISNPSLLSYTCIAKGTVVLAEFASKEEPGIEDVALRCIENTPPHHSIFSHTVRKKTYTFAIDREDSSLVYFAIADETMEKPESFRVLNRLRSAVQDLRSDAAALIDPSPRCLQAKMDPVFVEIVGGGGGDADLELDMDLVVARECRNLSIDSTKGRRAAMIPLLGKALKKNNKKRSLHAEDDSDSGAVDDETTSDKKKVDLCGNGNGGGLLRKELRNGLLTDHHKAKQMWKKHVWVVLVFDFCVCAVLFGIWLWVCQGFQCVSG